MKKIIALIFVLVAFMGFSSGQWQDPGQQISATICKTCTDEGFSYSDDLKCEVPIGNLLTNSTGIVIDCDKITPCVSLGGEYYGGGQCCLGNAKLVINNECRSCSTLSIEELNANPGRCSDDVSDCSEDKKYTENGQEKCCPGMLVPDSQDSSKKACITNTQGNLGINMNSDCLINGQCSYNIYKTLGIRQSDQNPSVSTFVQDIVLGITMFLGTAITIILIISGILYILAAILGKSNLADMAKKGIFNSILGLVLVSGSYAIVRLVQFVATAGGG
ncbi:MAG: hypothetical protein M0P94_00295 [Candidatus Absconditabacterales bacterium]|nr:hypothetical protein [Candidatus Absconditabacterales bacterium]